MFSAFSRLRASSLQFSGFFGGFLRAEFASILSGKNGPNRTISEGQNPVFGTKGPFLGLCAGNAVGLSLSFLGCSQRFGGLRDSSPVRVQQFVDCTWRNDVISLLDFLRKTVRCGRGIKCTVCGVWCGGRPGRGVVVVCLVWRVCVCVVRHARKTLCKLQIASLCTFITSPCLPATCPHVQSMCTFSRRTRRRYECTHGGVLESTHGCMRRRTRWKKQQCSHVHQR